MVIFPETGQTASRGVMSIPLWSCPFCNKFSCGGMRQSSPSTSQGLPDTMAGSSKLGLPGSLVLAEFWPFWGHDLSDTIRGWHNLSSQSCWKASTASASGSSLQLKNCGNWWVSLEANRSTSSGPRTWLIFWNTLWDSIQSDLSSSSLDSLSTIILATPEYMLGCDH